MTPRRDPAKTSDAKITGTTLRGKQRDRTWDAAHAVEVASYRIPPEMKLEVKEIAAELGVSPADVARLFLERGINDYQAGKIDVKPQPKQTGMTIFPE